MQNLDELRREAEEAKERLKRDIQEFHDILKKIALEGGERGRAMAEESLKLAGDHIDEAITQTEKRFESALAAVTKCNLKYDDFVTRRWDIGDFSGVETDCAFRVEISRAENYRVTVWASEELQECVNAVKSGSTLKLSLKALRFRARPIVSVKIDMPHVNKVRLGGASQGTVQGFTSEESFDANLSGNSTLDLGMEMKTLRGEISGASQLKGRINTMSTDLVLSGASRVTLTGSSASLVLNSWGASKLEMGEFTAKTAAIHLKGASEMVINVTDNLDIDLTGGSKLSYTGNPTISTISVTGASSLNHK